MHASALPPDSLSLREMEGDPSDRRSVSELVRANFDFVWRSLRRLGLSAADADDVAQQVFIVLARRLPEIQVGRERAFLFGAALKVASRLRRSQERRRESDGTACDSLMSPLPDPEAIIDRRRAAELLDRALDVLDEELRAVFILHEIEHLTMAEIAELLAIPNGTVASRLRRAREQFNRRLAALRGKQAKAEV